MKVRAESYKWNANGGIFWMSQTAGQNTQNLLEDYGQFELASIQKHE